LKEHLWRAGLRPQFSDRGPASGLTAVAAGMPMTELVDALVSNRPEMFDPRLARKRNRKSK
jgi:hypothetical protein